MGGATETAWKTRYKACEYALNTARAAAADGVVASGGVALACAAFVIENGAAGAAKPEPWKSPSTGSRAPPDASRHWPSKL